MSPSPCDPLFFSVPAKSRGKHYLALPSRLTLTLCGRFHIKQRVVCNGAKSAASSRYSRVCLLLRRYYVSRQTESVGAT